MSYLKEKTQTGQRSPRRYGRSMFGPIFLITLGLFLLFSNLGLLPDLHWGALLQLWPLLLVFGGLNVFVRAAPHPLGTILSALVAIAAAGLASYVLLFADQIPQLAEYSGTGRREYVREQVSFSADGVESADVSIDFSLPRAVVGALIDSGELIEADVTHSGQLVFDSSVTNGQAAVVLETGGSNDWFFWLNPANWDAIDDDNDWRIGLNPNVPLALDLNLGAGSTEIDLRGLSLENLAVDGGAGSATLFLPDGDYDLVLEVGAGATTLLLPEGGAHEFKLDGGAGRLTLTVPSSVAIRLELVDTGVGSLDINEGRLRQIEGDGTEEGAVWQTEGYDDSPNRVNILLEIGTGAVSLESM